MDNGEAGGYIVGAKWGYQQQMDKSLLMVAFVEMLKRSWLLIHKKIINLVCLRLKTIFGLNKFIVKTNAR